VTEVYLPQPVTARRAPEAVRPTGIRQICGTGTLIREAALELDERAGKVGHGERSIQDVRQMFYINPRPSGHISCRRSLGDKPLIVTGRRIGLRQAQRLTL
jgi:hypothetical protein